MNVDINRNFEQSVTQLVVTGDVGGELPLFSDSENCFSVIQ